MNLLLCEELYAVCVICGDVTSGVMVPTLNNICLTFSRYTFKMCGNIALTASNPACKAQSAI